MLRLLALLLSLAWGAVAHADAGLLVVLPLSGDGEAATRASVEERIRVAAGRYASVQAKEATAQALKTAATLGLSCDLADTTCAQQMAGLAGARVVVHGTLGRDGTLTLWRATVEEGRAPLPQRERLPDAGVARDAAIERVVLVLLAPERVTGRLTLQVNPRGASIVVDDIFRGPAPLPTALVLPPGPHTLYVTHPGYLAATRTVAIEVGGEQTVTVRLEPDPDAPVAPAFDSSVAPGDGDAGDPGDPERSSTTVVVFPWVVRGAPARVGAALDEAFAAELSRREGLIVIGPREVERALAVSPAGCLQRDECAAEVARTVGAAAFVLGSVETRDPLTTFAASRHDAGTALPVAADRADTLRGSPERLLPAIPDVADRLFPDHVATDEQAPLDLQVYGERMRQGPLRPWVFWTTAGVGGALAVATVAAGLVAVGAEDPADAGRAGAVFALGAGGTVVALGAAGVVGLLVDW